MDENERFFQKDEKQVMEKPMKIISLRATGTDPNGSYTGVPVNPFEKPVQDVDDL